MHPFVSRFLFSKKILNPPSKCVGKLAEEEDETMIYFLFVGYEEYFLKSTQFLAEWREKPLKERIESKNSFGKIIICIWRSLHLFRRYHQRQPQRNSRNSEARTNTPCFFYVKASHHLITTVDGPTIPCFYSSYYCGHNFLPFDLFLY